MTQVTALSEFTASHPRVGGLAGPSSPAQAFFCPLVSWAWPLSKAALPPPTFSHYSLPRWQSAGVLSGRAIILGS